MSDGPNEIKNGFDGMTVEEWTTMLNKELAKYGLPPLQPAKPEPEPEGEQTVIAIFRPFEHRRRPAIVRLARATLESLGKIIARAPTERAGRGRQ